KTEREGNRYDFKVHVRTEEHSAPNLTVIMNRSGSENGSGYVSLSSEFNNPKQDSNDLGLWVFDLQLNLANADVTRSESKLFFGLQAYSTFGIYSPVSNTSVKVQNIWVEPKI